MEVERNILKIIPYELIIVYLTFIYEYDYFRDAYSIEVSWILGLIYTGIFGGIVSVLIAILYVYTPKRDLFGKIIIYVVLIFLLFIYLADLGLLLFPTDSLIVPNLFTILFTISFGIVFLFIILKSKLDKKASGNILLCLGIIILTQSIIFSSYSLSFSKYFPIKGESNLYIYMYLIVGIILLIIGGFFIYFNQKVKEKKQSS
ncbi:MAG: hypothetical protein ACFFBP_23335 [Promethearchaeota archaeon]